MVINHLAGVSRRDLIKKIGFASVIALPLVSSIIAPKASAAASVCCPIGVCVQAGNDICAGCIGCSITIQRFFSTDGTCTVISGGTFTFTCVGTATNVADVFRT